MITSKNIFMLKYFLLKLLGNYEVKNIMSFFSENSILKCRIQNPTNSPLPIHSKRESWLKIAKGKASLFLSKGWKYF